MPRTGPVDINHFVPLLHRPVGELDCVDVADELHDEATDDNTPATACAEEVVMLLSKSPSDDDEAPSEKKSRTGLLSTVVTVITITGC